MMGKGEKRSAGKGRGAFTLLELLVVIVIMVALMTMIYRLTGISGGASSQASTVTKMQKLENALSGYLAAFGSYPPVKLHGYQDMFRTITEGGEYYDPIEYADKCWTHEWGTTADSNERHQMILNVKGAVMAQPISMDFPFEADGQSKAQIIETSNMIIEKIQKGVYDDDIESAKKSLGGLWQNYLDSALAGFDTGGDGANGWARFTVEMTDANGDKYKLSDCTDWTKLKLFRFGLLSFLLPRYLIMMGCAAGENGANGANPMDFGVWQAQNALPSRYWLDGTPYPDWQSLLNDYGGQDGTDDTLRWRIEMIPSQAVCQRWIQNLTGDMIIGENRTIFGVDIGNSMNSLLIERWMDVYDGVYTPGANAMTPPHDQYVLDNYTIQDGWSNDFYYYSPPPYTSYRLWSGGAGGTAVGDVKNEGATFPPWMQLTDLQTDMDITVEEQRRVCAAWMSDDVVHLSH